MASQDVVSRNGRYRISPLVTERDLAMHVDACYEAPWLYEEATGNRLLAFDSDTWHAITTIPWGEGGFQLRLVRIGRTPERYLVLDAGRDRFAVSEGFDGQMWNDELPAETLSWQEGLDGLIPRLAALFDAAEARLASKAEETGSSRLAGSGVPEIWIEYEEMELSMVHKVYWGTVRSSTDPHLFSLPSGRWDISKASDEDGDTVFHLAPEGDLSGNVLCYHPDTDRIRWTDLRKGSSGPWTASAHASDVWDKAGGKRVEPDDPGGDRRARAWWRQAIPGWLRS